MLRQILFQSSTNQMNSKIIIIACIGILIASMAFSAVVEVRDLIEECNVYCEYEVGNVSECCKSRGYKYGSCGFGAMKVFLLLSTVTLFATNATAQNEPPEDVNFECFPFGVSRFVFPGSCTRYHFCFVGSHAVRECGTDLHFDAWSGLCTFPERARCTRDVCPVTNDIDNIVTFPSESSCQEYFMCVDGNLERFTCDWGIHWNQMTQRCERPENAQCEATTLWPQPQSTDGDEPQTTTKFICPEMKGLHVYPNPSNCGQYFECFNNIPLLRDCMTGLLFDSNLLSCNLAKNVICA